MAMIFPGMDPYLENPRLWPGLHNRLVVYIADLLQARLPRHYVAALEERVFLEDTAQQYVPDLQVREQGLAPEHGGAMAIAEFDQAVLLELQELEVHESYIEIRDLNTNQRVVTVIEVVSPSNKRPGPGQDAYRQKQQEVLGSTANLVEIDLLRGGQHVLSLPPGGRRLLGPHDYLVCVNPAPPNRGKYRLYPRSLRDRLPRIGVPLAGSDPDVPLDVQAAVGQVYEAGRYREVLDYRAACIPALEGDCRTWAETVVAATCSAGGPTPR